MDGTGRTIRHLNNSRNSSDCSTLTSSAVGNSLSTEAVVVLGCILVFPELCVRVRACGVSRLTVSLFAEY